MSADLIDRLMLRFRSEYSDLSDEEYEAYSVSLLSRGSSKVLNDVIECGTPKVTTRMVYKTIEVRGKKRRVPVTMTTEQKPDDIPDHLKSEGGCLMLRSLLNLSLEGSFTDLLDESEFAFDLPLGFADQGDLICVDGVWGVVEVANVTDSTFTLVRVCDSFERVVIDATTPHIAYRIML